MSNRAIADAVGADEITVRRDKAGATNAAPEPKTLKADALLQADPFALLTGMLLDQQIAMELAFAIQGA